MIRTLTLTLALLAAGTASAKQADAIEAFAKASPAAKDAIRKDVCQPSDAGLKGLAEDDQAAYRAIKASLRNTNVGFCKSAR